MRLNDYFDRVVVINLDRRNDRLKAFESQTKDLGIDFVRYSAVDAQAFGISRATACSRSHHKVLTDAAADGVQRLLVLEDDADFKHNFNQAFERIVQVLPDDWQMFYLGGNSYSNEDIGITILDIMQDVGIPYMLATKGGDRFVEFIQRSKPCVIYFSVATLSDRVSKAVEPNAPLPSERLRMIEAAIACGHKVVAGINPCVPDWMLQSL